MIANFDSFRLLSKSTVTRIGLAAILLFTAGDAFANAKPKVANAKLKVANAKPKVDIVVVGWASEKYRVRRNGELVYNGTDFTEAMKTAAGRGNRVINVHVGGKTDKQVRLFANTTLNWSAKSPWDSDVKRAGDRSGATIFAGGVPGIRIKGLRMTTTSKKGPGFGIRLSGCPGARIEDVVMDWKGRPVFAGIRVDNESSKQTIDGIYLRNIEVRNTPKGSESHGVETMGMNKVDFDDIRGFNLGGCACLVQAGSGGKIGTVKGVKCGWNTGYATMRFANGYSNCEVKRVISDGKGVGGRGLFILESEKITVNEVSIHKNTIQAIYIQKGKDNLVKAGSVSGQVLIGPKLGDSPGSRVNVTIRR